MAMIPASCIPCPKIENDSYDWYARHELKLKQTKEAKHDFVFIGDSLTHFWGTEEPFTHGGDVWHKYYDGRKVLNLGYGFDRTQNVLWRLEHGELEGQNPKMIVLNIGTNQFSGTANYPCDTPENAAVGICAVLKKLREIFPGTRLLAMALLPRFFKNDPKRHLIADTNRIVAERVKELENLRYLDIGEKFLRPDGELKLEIYRGDTHLMPEAYEIWAEAIEPEFRRFEKTETVGRA